VSGSATHTPMDLFRILINKGTRTEIATDKKRILSETMEVATSRLRFVLLSMFNHADPLELCHVFVLVTPQKVMASRINAHT
jgi:hypothetical protein